MEGDLDGIFRQAAIDEYASRDQAGRVLRASAPGPVVTVGGPLAVFAVLALVAGLARLDVSIRGDGIVAGPTDNGKGLKLVCFLPERYRGFVKPGVQLQVREAGTPSGAGISAKATAVGATKTPREEIHRVLGSVSQANDDDRFRVDLEAMGPLTRGGVALDPNAPPRQRAFVLRFVNRRLLALLESAWWSKR